MSLQKSSNQILTNSQCFSKAGNPFSTVDIIGCQVLEGNVFTFIKRVSFEADEVISVIFDTSAYTGDYVYAFNPTFRATAGPIRIDGYINSKYSGGSDVSSFIFNNSANPAVFKTAKSKIIVGATIDTPGIITAERLVPASGSNPATATGSESIPGDVFYEFPAGAIVEFEFTNDNGADTLVELTYIFIEL
jgi:hypothetical protein